MLVRVSPFLLLALVSCHRLSPMEQKLVGTWQWEYIEGTGHMTFTRDHKILYHLDDEGQDHSKPPKDRVKVVTAGTWHLKGNTLVLSTDNEWLRAMYERTSRHIPPFKKEV